MQLATRPDRQTLRERERKSRERRAAKLEWQRATLEALENVAPIIPTLFDDDDQVWNAVLNPKAARLRTHMRGIMRLEQEQRQLEQDQAQLGLMLQEHRLATLAIEGMLGFAARDEWEECVKRWRAITLRYYESFSLEDCLAELEICQKEVNAFLWSLDTQVIGVSFFGWRARLRIVQSRDAVQFSFEKTIRGFPMEDFVRVGWDCYTDVDVYDEYVIGNRGRGWVEALQKLTPEIWIVRCVERYPGISLDAHKVYLVGRVETETGFTQFVRSMPVPKVEEKTCERTGMWATNFVWLQWDRLNEDANDYKVHIGGKLSGHDSNYAGRWLVETLAVLLRVEQLATKRGLLSSG